MVHLLQKNPTICISITKRWTVHTVQHILLDSPMFSTCLKPHVLYLNLLRLNVFLFFQFARQVGLHLWWLWPFCRRPRCFLPAEVNPRISLCLWTGLQIQLNFALCMFTTTETEFGLFWFCAKRKARLKLQSSFLQHPSGRLTCRSNLTIGNMMHRTQQKWTGSFLKADILTFLMELWNGSTMITS